jgi:hypothetical protein
MGSSSIRRHQFSQILNCIIRLTWPVREFLDNIRVSEKQGDGHTSSGRCQLICAKLVSNHETGLPGQTDRFQSNLDDIWAGFTDEHIQWVFRGSLDGSDQGANVGKIAT